MDTNEIKGTARDVEGKIKDGYGGLTGNTGTQVDGKIDQAAGKIQARYGEAIDNLTGAAHAAADSASATVSDLREKLSTAAKTVQSEARNAGGVVNDTVHESPWLSVIGMAAIGYVAAFLIHSPSSPLAPRPPEPKYLPRRLARYF
jgi:uncharacterized protein YjbJ (UPF0337 family)